MTFNKDNQSILQVGPPEIQDIKIKVNHGKSSLGHPCVEW